MLAPIRHYNQPNKFIFYYNFTLKEFMFLQKKIRFANFLFLDVPSPSKATETKFSKVCKIVSEFVHRS